ncbi:DUF7837 family putative zinc-binding protein [Halostella limicola]
MSRPTPLGRCPRCQSQIPPSFQLVEYEVDDQARCYAECPDCNDVVRPS